MLPAPQRPVEGPSEFYSIGIADESNKLSLVNRAPEAFAGAINNAYVRKYLAMTEEELAKKIPENLLLLAKRLRTSLWREYERNIDQKGSAQRITLQAVLGGVCSRELFEEHILQNPIILAYVLMAPTNYVVAMEESLEHGINRMREIMNFPVYQYQVDKNGNFRVNPHTGEYLLLPDHKSAELILKSVFMLDQRMKGAVAQQVNINQRQVSVNLTKATQKAPPVHVDSVQVQEKVGILSNLDRRLNQLQIETEQMKRDPGFDHMDAEFITPRADSIIAEKIERICE